MKKQEYDILFEDDDMIIINKSSGLLSIPDRFNSDIKSAYNLLKDKYPSIYTVHRIDRETSGLLCFAKNAETHKAMNILFENNEVNKEYHAICYSIPEISEGVIDVPIAHSGKLDGKMVPHPKGKESITKYKCIESWQKYSLIKLKPLTGRTHQIRVHMAYIRCPLIGEKVYHDYAPLTISTLKPRAHVSIDQEEKALITRVALHASHLEFELNNKHYSFDAEMPKDMKATLHQMRKCLKSYPLT